MVLLPLESTSTPKTPRGHTVSATSSMAGNDLLPQNVSLWPGKHPNVCSLSPSSLAWCMSSLVSLYLVLQASFPLSIFFLGVLSPTASVFCPAHSCSHLPVPDKQFYSYRPFTSNACHSLRLCDLCLYAQHPLPSISAGGFFQIHLLA